MRTLTREEARRVYDRIGKAQDSQAFYEDSAIDILVEHGHFESAERVFEFGCGTGRLAERLLTEELPADATYRGVDISPKMIALAEARVGPFGPRASVVLTEGSPPEEEPTAAYDRFVSTYVLDLLSENDIDTVLREAHRILAPGGLLCLSSLSTGSGPASRVVARVWAALHRLSPAIVGGCRPVELADWLGAPEWTILHRAQVAPFAVPSEVLVAERARG